MSRVLGEQRRTSPTQSDQVIGCTFFWFVFFMQVKKMNVYQNDHFVLFISFFYLPCQSSAVLYADNRRSKKRAPSCAGPSDYLEFMPRIGGYISLMTGRWARSTSNASEFDQSFSLRQKLPVYWGSFKTHRLRRFKQVQRFIPSTAVMLSGTERDYNQKISIYYILQNKILITVTFTMS